MNKFSRRSFLWVTPVVIVAELPAHAVASSCNLTGSDYVGFAPTVVPQVLDVYQIPSGGSQRVDLVVMVGSLYELGGKVHIESPINPIHPGPVAVIGISDALSEGIAISANQPRNIYVTIEVDGRGVVGERYFTGFNISMEGIRGDGCGDSVTKWKHVQIKVDVI